MAETDLGHWTNQSGIELNEQTINESMGFIYEIRGKDWFYIGRRQFWLRRGKNWYDSGWRDYTSSSSNVQERIKDDEVEYTILAVFKSKAFLRLAEASAIIRSGSYCCTNGGLNERVEAVRGRLPDECESDRQQLEKLERYFKRTNL